MIHRFFLAFLLFCLVMTGCSNGEPESATPSPSKPTVQPSPVSSTATPVSHNQTIKFKSDKGNELFALKPGVDGAKLIDANQKELSKFKLDTQQKLQIRNPASQPVGFVVTEPGVWKLKNADQTKELYVLRHQPDQDYKLETGANQELYRIKARGNGLEIETPDKKSLYKVKVKGDKISLRNAQDKTVLYTKGKLPPIAIACFGFDGLSREQQAALAYAVNLSGGR